VSEWTKIYATKSIVIGVGYNYHLKIVIGLLGLYISGEILITNSFNKSGKHLTF